jgi:Glycosyl transferase family 2
VSYSIVIPSKNADNLKACLKALRDAGETARVIVVDDGVDWDKGPVIPEIGIGVRIAKGVNPFVFSRNCNIGILAAGDDDVVLLNDDALLSQPPYGPRDLIWNFAWLGEACRGNIGLCAATTNLTGQPLQHPNPNGGVRCVSHLAFVCVYIPRRTISLIGLLDERYNRGYGCEDRDYCESVNRAGLKCAVHDFVYVDHGSLKSSFRGAPTTGGDFSANYQLLMEKWGGKLTE